MRKITNYCGGCNRPLVEYKRFITIGMRQFLENLYQLHINNPHQEFWHYRQVITKNTGGLDFSLLEAFRLIKRNPEQSGFWSIKPLGENFVNGKASVPKFLKFYLGKIIEESQERIFINQLGKEKFKLEAIMGTVEIKENALQV